MSVPDDKAGAKDILSAIALAAAGFLLGAAAVHASIRDPLHLHADMRSEKLAMLDQWHGKVFSAAFGSSHVHNGFDPAAFNRTLASTPAATQAANLAVEGGSQTEQRIMALEFLKHLESPAAAQAPPQPCLILLELEAGANFGTQFFVHPRAINVYDWPTTHLVASFAPPGMSLKQRGGRIGFALIEMALHYTNVGMLSNLIFAPPLDNQALTDQTADGRLGERVMLRIPINSAAVAATIAAAPSHPTIVSGSLTPGSQLLIAQLAAASSVKDVSFAYIVMPMLRDLTEAPDYPDHLTVDGRDVPIINLGRPDRFPQLFAPALWYDGSHLERSGATLASTLLAAQLKQWYAAHGAPPRCGG